jgi:Flp pilus assembly pilin Flp
MFKPIDQFRRSRSGAVAVEYALLGGCIVLSIIVAVSFLSTRLNMSYSTVAASFQ